MYGTGRGWAGQGGTEAGRRGAPRARLVLYYTILYYTIPYHTILYYTILLLYYTMIQYKITRVCVCVYICMCALLLSTSRTESNRPVSAEARTYYILCKPHQVTRRAVDNRFITGTTAALRSWLLTGGPTPFCLCKPFSCKACPGIL